VRGGGRNILLVLWQHKALVLLGAVVGVTLGLLNYSQRPPVYRATAQVLVVKKQAGQALTDRIDVRDRLMDDYVSTHLIVIRSPTIISKAVAKRNLGSLKSLQGGNPAGIIQNGLVASREANKESGAGGGGGGGGTNNIINLSYSGSDPADTETILNAVIESYKDFLDETYQNTSEATVTLIRSAADTLTTNLTKKEEEYRAFRRTSPLLIVGENGTPFHQSKILNYQKDESTAQEQVGALKKRIEAIEKAIEEKQPRDHILALAERKYDAKAVTPTGQATKANAAALEAALFELKKLEADLLQFYGEDHPDVVRLRRRMEMTKEFHKKIEAMVAEGLADATDSDPVRAALKGLQVELALAQMQQSLAKKRLDDEVSHAREVQADYDRDRGFRVDIERIQKVLDTTLKRLEEINLVRGYGGFEAKAIAPPVPGMKASPILWQFLFIGLTLGLMAGCGGAYLLDLADKSFRTPEEIRRRLGLPLVGHVPFANKPTEPVKVTDAAGNPVELDPGLATVHRPISPEAEAYRGVRTALFFNTRGERHKVIQVTSPNMGDGKTTLITNLAVAIAQSGRKVLLVDADLRRPRVHRAFGVSGRVGLAEMLIGTAELDEAIQVTAIPNLSVLPCGRRPANPAELLTSPRFEDALDDLREAFDYVLVDSPPLLAVSDPCVVAPRVDGLILTIRIAKNGRPAAERARDMLTGLKVNCIGIVVNGVGKQGAMAGYGYDNYKYADEYTTAYTTADQDAHADQDPAESPPAEQTPASAPGRGPAAPAPAANAPARPHPVLNGRAEHSTNGHGHPPHNGE
jgi:capsular exopolysaccharide synthesis family protein